MPPLFLQPLFENAVTHGIAEVLDGGTITVDVNRRGDRLAIAIENPCDPDALTPMRHGTGMTNVRQRLTRDVRHRRPPCRRAPRSGRFRVDINLPFSSDD